MARDFQQTHENILNSGRKLFLENGYERTNLREVCKDANVTTGAFYRHFSDKEALFTELVLPVINGIDEMYLKSQQQCFDYIAADELIKVWQVSGDAVIGFIQYIYDNFDRFKLLLRCSNGTKYSSFVDDMVSTEVTDMIRFLEELKKQGILVKSLSENELHMLSHSYFSSIFEIVMHDYSKEDALKYAQTLVDFFSVGWRFVLGV